MPPNSAVAGGQETVSSPALSPSTVSASPAVAAWAAVVAESAVSAEPALVAVEALLAVFALLAVVALLAVTAVCADGTVPSVERSITLDLSELFLICLLVIVSFFSLLAPIECLTILLPLIWLAA